MIEYKGGDGTSQEQAIKIVGAKNEREGVDAEYSLIERIMEEYTVLLQEVLCEEYKSYDRLVLQDVNGNEYEIWFDITEFYGKR